MMRLAFAIALAVFVSDQASKWVILNQVMAPPRVIEVLPVFNLVLVFNEGISFGMLGGTSALKGYLLAALAVAVSIGLFWWLSRDGSRPVALAVGLIAGGALGNALDRLLHGAVVDFLDFHIGGRHWPAFNVADSAITLGVAAILISDILMTLLRRSRRIEKAGQDKGER